MKIAIIVIGISTNPKLARRTALLFQRRHIKNSKVFTVINIVGTEGYAIGVNKGIARAQQWGADIYIVANHDLENIKITASSLKEVAQSYDVWGYDFMQNGQRLSYGKLDRWRLTGSLVERTKSNIRQKPDFVSGSLICFKKTVVEKIGKWDESYFMYYEDVEYCQRAIAAGFRVGVIPRVMYKHLENKTTSNSSEQLTKSWFRFFRRNASPIQWGREILRLPKTIFIERKLFVNELAKRPFIRNFLTLNFSSLSIKGLNFVLFLVLVRKLNPNSFGLYNLVWAQVALFMPLADLGTTNYGIFHLRKNSQKQFSQLFTFRALLGIIFAVLTCIYSAAVFRNTTITILTLLSIPIMVANSFSGSYLILTTVLSSAYRAAYLSMLYNGFLIASLIALLFKTQTMFWLFFVEGVFAVGYMIVLWVRTNELITIKIALPTRTYIMRTVRGSFVYVLLTFFAGLYFKIDLFLLQYFKGSSAVGLYSSGYKFFEALIFLGSSYTIAATPIYKRFLSQRATYSGLRSKLLRDTALLFIGGMMLAVFSSALTPYVLSPIMGEKYRAGLQVFQIVIFALPFLLVSAVSMNVLYLMKKTRFVVWLFVAQIIINTGANVYFIPLFSYQASAIITVVSEVLNAVVVLPLALKVYEDLS